MCGARAVFAGLHSSDTLRPPAPKARLTRPFDYVVYGVNVHSEFPLRGLRTGRGGAGGERVTVTEGEVLSQTQRTPQPGCFDLDQERIFLWHPRAGAVLVRGGRELIVERLAQADEGLLQSILLGQGFASLFLQRGRPVIHASAITVGERAAAFVGEKGAGKSTLASAFVRAGYGFVTDDLVVWTVREGWPEVHPGYSFVKLWGPSVQAGGFAPHALSPLSETVPKWIWGTPTVTQARPLQVVYDLAYGESFTVERMSRAEAFVTLARHAFAGDLADAAGQSVPHRQGVASLARTVPVFRMTRPHGFEKEASVVSSIVDQMRGPDVKSP